MLSVLFGLINPLAALAGKIADARMAAQNAVTDRERIAAEERVKDLEARRAVLVAEAAGSRVNVVMRAAIAFGPTVYLLKIFIWDKVLKLGATDSLSGELWQVVTAVIGFYFLYEGAIGVAKVMRR
jgi:hypothetical protein